MADYLDTRDLWTEREELHGRLSDLEVDDNEDDDDLKLTQEERDDLALDDEEADRLAALDALYDEIGSGTEGGETMIPEDDFEDYARELAEEVGAVDPDAGWPLTCIDWEQAAKELSMDYSMVSFDGDDYWVRL